MTFLLTEGTSIRLINTPIQVRLLNKNLHIAPSACFIERVSQIGFSVTQARNKPPAPPGPIARAERRALLAISSKNACHSDSRKTEQLHGGKATARRGFVDTYFSSVLSRIRKLCR